MIDGQPANPSLHFVPEYEDDKYHLKKVSLFEGPENKGDVSFSQFWVNGLPLEHIKGFRSLDIKGCTVVNLGRDNLQQLDEGAIPDFENKAENISNEEIAKRLWLKPEVKDHLEVTFIEMVRKVAVYLKSQCFEMVGVPDDKDSFCNAFLKSYKTLSKKIDVLDREQNQVFYLRGLIYQQYNNLTALRIKTDKDLTLEEGISLTKALEVHVRIIKIKEGTQDWIEDKLIFPDKSSKEWKDLTEEEKAKKHQYFSIVQLAGHFLTARPLSQKNYALTLKRWESTKKFNQKEIQLKEVTVEHDGKPYNVPVITLLKVIGLKKYMAKLLCEKGLLNTETPFKKWKLIHKERQLSNENTLEDCDLNPKLPIYLRFNKQPDNTPNLQMAVKGSSYTFVKDFDNLVSSIKTKIPIVCHIETPEGYGTGFLIGNKIITNEHVISKVKIKEKEEVTLQQPSHATFFYEETNSIKVKLTRVEYDSRQNYPVEIPKKGALDFAIVSFIADSRLNELVEIGDKFFQKYKLGNEVETNYLKKRRANIIQHPRPKEVLKNCVNPTGKKTIAFRETAIKEAKDFHLHYQSFTSEASSGSPVISDEGEFIGLHFSSCKTVDIALFQQLDFLVEALDIPRKTNYRGDDPKFYRWWENEELGQIILYRKRADKENRGTWVAANNNKRRNLRSLVEQIIKGESDTWILKFLEKQYPGEFKKYTKHMQCNIAIPANRIFEELELEWKEGVGLSDMQKESKEIIKNLKQQKIYKFIGFAAVVLVALGCYNHKDKIINWWNQK